MEQRYLDIEECKQYLHLGESKCRSFMKEIGAERKIGKRCVYDRLIIDSYLEQQAETQPEPVSQ